MPQDGDDAVTPDPRTDQPILMLGEQRIGRFAHRAQQGVCRALVGVQERLDGASQIRVAAAGMRQAIGAIFWRNVDDLIEQRSDALPSGLRDHVERQPVISLRSHARASRMSRCTVAVEAFAASAICS